MDNNNILFIGLSGYAGSGKDTVAKALTIMLEHDFKTYDEFKKYYDENSGYGVQSNFKYATLNDNNSNNSNNKHKNSRVMCVAFADTLKEVCAALFGVPIDCFYYNKESGYIRLNDFKYTETKPTNIISADDFFFNNDVYVDSTDEYYMSLREILVFVGTYLIQQNINRLSFVNSVNNKVRSECNRNDKLKYVICTDVRFEHELHYIKRKNGVNIRVLRDVSTLDNVAEHRFDDDDDLFDLAIDNNGSYDDLFRNVWNMVHKNGIFNNETLRLNCRDDSNNYLRKIYEGDETVFEFCYEHKLQAVNIYNDELKMIDPQGGPRFSVGDTFTQSVGLDEYDEYEITDIYTEDVASGKTRIFIQCKYLGRTC